MAMNKAEKAKMEQLQQAVALHWPAYPRPEPMTAEQIRAALEDIPRRDLSVPAQGTTVKAARGWFMNVYSSSITRGWTGVHSQNRQAETGDGGSRVNEPMWATRMEAAMALRIALSEKYAASLAAVDAVIAEGNPQ
jgi:membrane carboxypeptidase/penicillin-binding protein